MSDTFSNPGNASFFADLGITIRPGKVQHANTWRPHPILGFIPVVSIPNGSTGQGVRRWADWSAGIAFSENTAMTDQAHPSITTVDPTLVGRGFSYSQTVQGRQRVADGDWDHTEKIRDQKVVRVLVDDLTHLSGNANSIIALSSSVTDVTVDAAGNASLDGLFACIRAVGRPAVAFYDAVGIQGIVDSMRAEGNLYANQGVSAQVARAVGDFQPDMVAADGFCFEIAGCRIYQTNEREGDGTRLYEDSSITHGIVMADFRRRMEAARGGSALYQYNDVAFPIVLEGRADPIPGLPDILQPDPEFLVFRNPPGLQGMIADGDRQMVAYGRWLDIGNNVAGYKYDFGGQFDPILANSGYIRCHQYATTYQS